MSGMVVEHPQVPLLLEHQPPIAISDKSTDFKDASQSTSRAAKAKKIADKATKKACCFHPQSRCHGRRDVRNMPE